MSLFEKNWEIFKKRYADTAVFLEGLRTDNYQVIQAENGDPILQVSFPDGRSIFVHDANDPRKKTLGFVPKEAHKKSLFIVMGIGLGYVLFDLVKKYPEAIILVVEHDSRIFKTALKTFDYTALLANPKISFFVSYKPEKIFMPFLRFFMDGDNSNYLPVLQLVQDESVIQFSKPYYISVADVFKRAIDFFWEVFVGNEYRDTLHGVKNIFINLKMSSKMMAVEPYKNIFKGREGIVVSSGPSLNNKLAYLKAIQHAVPIICADSALKVLLSNGIKPFGVASIERDLELPRVFEGYDIPNDIILFMSPQIDPRIVDIFPGPVCLLFRYLFPFTLLPEIVPMRNLGASCSHMAFMMLHWLGCKKISLVGQDLAYDRASGKTHFDGIVEYAAEADAKLDRVQVPDHQGGMIPTNAFWALYRDIFTQFALEMPDHTLQNVIEAQFGALIPGFNRVEPDSYFKTFESGSLQLFERPDFSFGKEYLKNSMQQHYSDIPKRMNVLCDGLQDLKLLIQGYDRARSAEDYFWIKSTIREEISENVWSAFDSYFMSVSRRFDALAQSIWTPEEFRVHRDDYVRRAVLAIDELLDCLKPSLSA